MLVKELTLGISAIEDELVQGCNKMKVEDFTEVPA